MRYFVHRADGSTEAVDIHQVGLKLGSGDRFEMICATGGGYGDPLDRAPREVRNDLLEQRIEAGTAHQIYGVMFQPDGQVDVTATETHRNALRQARLQQSRPPALQIRAQIDEATPALPLYPGVIQRGNLAVSECSGVVLAIAPANWLDGCRVLDTKIDERAGGTIMRAHLDPATGRALFVDVLRASDGPSIEIMPRRWICGCEQMGRKEAAA